MTGFLLYVIALRFNVTEMMPVSMSRLFDCMDEGCIMIGSARRVAVINDACTAILPRADRSILGKYSETVFIIYPELVWAMDAPLVPRKDIELPTGQFLEVTVKEVQVTRWARRIMIKDLTERRRMDEDLRRANAPLQMMSRLAKHDIINIVAAIHCFASLIELRADDDKMAHTAQRTRQAAENVQRISRSTQDYLDADRGKGRWQDINSMRRKTQTSLDLSAVAVVSHVDGFEILANGMFERVISNLIENSLRHGERATWIAITCGEMPNNLHLTVSDDGGIMGGEKGSIFRQG